MQSKLDPNKTFSLRNIIQAAKEEQEMAKIMEKDLPFPTPFTFYVDNEDEDELQEELSQGEPPTKCNISTFLRLPQKVVSRHRPTYKPLKDYSQSQILTLHAHVETLQTIAQRKEDVAIEKERKKLEKELTKQAKEVEKPEK